MNWQLRDRALDLSGIPLVMGIVNVTPDSFSDGGRYLDVAAAVAHGFELVRQGADLLDVGGESSRPGAETISVEEELRRVVPVIRELAGKTSVPLSVDTTKAEIARQALAAGAQIVNDITALRGDPDMPAVVRDSGAGAILMHMQGTPRTMQTNPTYGDVVLEVSEFLQERLCELTQLGIAVERLAIDPGIGFGKTTAHNWQLIARLGELRRSNRPVCLGVSRKGFIGKRLGRTVSERLAGSLAVACHALAHRSAQIFRVHDVAATRDAIEAFGNIAASGLGP